MSEVFIKFCELILKKNITKKRISNLESIISIIVNISIGIVKILTGMKINSITIISDGIHSFSDTFTSIIVWVSAFLSAKPPDKKHPFGHQRIELISTFILGWILLFTGLEILKQSYYNIINPKIINFDQKYLLIVSIILILTMIIKEILARFSIVLGETYKIPTLIADGQHHRSDALSTLVTIIAVFGMFFKINYIDGIGGIIITLFIFKIAISIIKDTATHLIGTEPDDKLMNDIIKEIKKFPNVHNIHDIIIHDYGSTKIVSLHIEIENKISLCEAHNLSEQIEDMLTKKFNIYSTIHIDPINKDHSAYNKIKKEIEYYLKTKKQSLSFHDLRIVGSEESFNVLFDIKIDNSIKASEHNKIKSDLEEYLKKNNPEIKNIIIKIEPFFTY